VFSPTSQIIANKAKNLLKDFHIMAQETEPLFGFFNKPPALVGENTNKREEGGKREGLWSSTVQATCHDLESGWLVEVETINLN
jgi:hypothetical protein